MFDDIIFILYGSIFILIQIITFVKILFLSRHMHRQIDENRLLANDLYQQSNNIDNRDNILNYQVQIEDIVQADINEDNNHVD